MAEEILSQPRIYKEKIEEVIQKELTTFGVESHALKACEYALLNGGKRFRPTITLLVAEALGKGLDVTHSALTVEYFHTASLIADDLPCMDDDDERRDKPSLHKVYGEALALLVTYALIAEGYRALWKNGEVLRQESVDADQMVTIALENATYNTGLMGATGGQLLDIMPPDLSLETVRQVIHQKTGSLFEIAFVNGWLFGGGDPSCLAEVKKAAYHFGQAFQIADDLGDQEQDLQNERKINVANLFGKDKARELFQEEKARYQTTLASLNIATPSLLALIESN